MAKVYKVTHYIVESEGYLYVDSIAEILAMELNAIVTLANVEESDEFEWTDDIDLNRVDATLEEYEAYLNKRR